MPPEYIPQNYYDRYGEDGFTRWVFAVLERVYGPDNFIPGPSRGMDGGVDAEYVRSGDIPFQIQIKWREVSRSTSSKLRAEIFEKFTNEVKQKDGEGKVIKYLFITNVSLTNSYQEKFKEIIRNYPDLNIEFWDFEKLNLYLRDHVDLFRKHCPYITKEEQELWENKQNTITEKLRADRLEAISEAEFLKLQYDIKNLFIDLNLQRRLFYAFIFLMEPFYTDKRGDAVRATVRKLLDLSQDTEQEYLGSLEKENSIQITAGLATVNDRELAKKILNEMVNHLGVPLERVIDLLMEVV